MPAERRLSHLLLASHALLVLLLAALLLLGAADAVRGAVLGQARVQVEQGVVEARARLRDWRRELSVRAGLLAELPDLRQALASGQRVKLQALLVDFAQTSGLTHLRIHLGESLQAEHGEGPVGDSARSPRAPGWWFDARGELWRIEQAPVAGVESAVVLVAGRLGHLVRSRAPLDFVQVDLLPLESDRSMATAAASDAAEPSPQQEWQAALRAVSASGDPETLDGLHDHAVARIVSVRDERGQPVALLAARIEPEWIRQRIREWLGRFGLMVAIALGLALGLAAWWSRRIARPFAQLVRAAAPLGEGRLEQAIAIPFTRLAEARALGAQLQDLRLRVLSLTASERAQRLQLDTVLDGVDAGIASIDDQQRVRYANRRFQLLVGYAGDELVGQVLPQLLVADRSGIDWPAGPGRERVRSAAGGPPLVLRRMTPEAAGQQILVLREQSAQEAAGALRDHILANLSHEFQTPLAAQMAAIELLREHLRHGGDPVAAQLADAQFRGALRLSQLVDNLLDSVRVDSGEMRLRQQLVDLPGLIREAVELLTPLTAQREQVVQLDLPPGPALPGDPQRLHSVVVNLLSNANKYAPDRSTIGVRLAWESGCVTLWVTDEGPGLPDWPDAADLFAPFRRAPQDEPQQRGNGLGLAIVRAIVAAHAGQVLVAGTVPGAGACIGVCLPLEPSCAS